MVTSLVEAFEGSTIIGTVTVVIALLHFVCFGIAHIYSYVCSKRNARDENKSLRLGETLRAKSMDPARQEVNEIAKEIKSPFTPETHYKEELSAAVMQLFEEFSKNRNFTRERNEIRRLRKKILHHTQNQTQSSSDEESSLDED